MKDHAVLKMYEPLAGDASIPNWQDFISDKSVIRDTVNAEVDRLLRDLGLSVWVTREYKPAQLAWSADERREGLDRTYRLVFQQDYELPEDFVDRLLHLPSVEMASRLSVGSARLPKPETLTCVSCFDWRGSMLPEFDRFGLFTHQEALGRVGKAMSGRLAGISLRSLCEASS